MTQAVPISSEIATQAVLRKGSNQSGMRAYNERLVLTLIRQAGAMAKAEIARRTGLSAQTVSVIMRALEADGLLERGEPVFDGFHRARSDQDGAGRERTFGQQPPHDEAPFRYEQAACPRQVRIAFR